MYLSKEEERMLEGEMGVAVAEAMRLVVSVGEALGAERLVRISHAHVSGISYNNIGEPGLEWVKRLYEGGGRARVYSTFNPAGTCLCGSSPLNKPSLVYKQSKIIGFLLKMGFHYTATCTPYFYRKPERGEHLAWGESSAVAVANSLYAARTNREGGPLALAAAITGRTYYWGLHLEENRSPRTRIVVETRAKLGPVKAGLVGYYAGKTLGGETPYIDAHRPLEFREAVELCAAGAAGGSIAHCIIRGVSPEDQNPPKSIEKVLVGDREIEEARSEVETGSLEEARVFFTGCPHLSPREALEAYFTAMEKWERLTQRRKEVWIALPGYLSRSTYWQKLYRHGLKKNIRLLFGTCPVVAELRETVEAIATDSVKTAFYLSKKGIKVALADLHEFIYKTL